MAKKKTENKMHPIIKEILNSTSPVKERYKVQEFYRDVVTRKEHPVSMNWILAFLEKWILWAREDEGALNPSYYVLYAGVPWKTLMSWCDKYPEVQEAYDQVKQFIKLRRELKYIETNGSALAFMMPHYDEDYKAQHEWRSNLKAQEQLEKREKIEIVMKDYTRDKDEIHSS